MLQQFFLKGLRSVGHDGARFLKAAFKLSSNGLWTTLATWDHFGVVATKSDTAMTRRVQAHFLESGVRMAADALAEDETATRCTRCSRAPADSWYRAMWPAARAKCSSVFVLGPLPTSEP
jgi:hypothetical protein